MAVPIYLPAKDGETIKLDPVREAQEYCVLFVKKREWSRNRTGVRTPRPRPRSDSQSLRRLVLDAFVDGGEDFSSTARSLLGCHSVMA